MLATTEAHKLPETIISRTQRFSLKPVELTKVSDHLRKIANDENIAVDDDALALIAEHGEGSFRDSISLLDQVRNSSDHVMLADVQAVLGIAPKELIESLVAAVATHDAALTIQLLAQAHNNGHEPVRMAKQLGEVLRTQLLENQSTLSAELLLRLLSKLIEVPSSGDPRSNLEVALLETALAGTQIVVAKPKTSKVMSEEVQTKPAVQIDPHPAIARKRAAHPELEPPAEKENEARVTLSSDTLDASAWSNILGAIKQKHNTLYGIIRTARPYFEPGVITLECSFAFHQKKLNEKASKQIIADIVQSITGHNMQIQCVVGEAVDPTEIPAVKPILPPAEEKIHTVAAKPATEDIKAISNIFGGAELLES
jgi:DNA polymerase-3 subunit gamma/tau